jgi:protein TonB
MAQVDRERNRDRIKAGIGVALFHALLGYALITGLGFEVVRQVSDNLKVFVVLPEPPPPPMEEPIPAEVRTEAPEGAAAPPSLKAQPSPIIAPPPKVRLDVPPPVAAVPEPTPLPPGTDASAGVSTVDGTGTGTGGEGKGTGSGGAGSGSGGGGRPAARVRGGFTPRDYSRIAGPQLLQGTVHVRYTIQADGHVTNCAVTKSSGHFRLDRATCEAIEDRFRYRPALDTGGRPVVSTKNTSFAWSPNPE